MKHEEKKVTLFIGSLTGGGAERVTCNLANYLYQKGYIVDLITMSDVKDNYELNKNINRIYLINKKDRKNKIHDTILRYKNLKKYILNNRDIDCYVVMLPITIMLLISLKKYINGKVIISERNNPSTYKLYEKMIMKYASKRCDGLVVQTKEIGKWYSNKNQIVIPNAINKDITFSLRNENLIEDKIVAVGRLDKQKNYKMLLDAFYKFSLKYPNYKLEIYGKGPQEEMLKEIVNNYGLNDKVFFMGYVKDIDSKICNAKVFVMTSIFEGMPNSLIEALCMGIPCITTDFDGGGAKELIINNENGILISKNDVEALVTGLEKIVNDNKFSNLIGKNAKKIRDKLSYDIIYNKWENYIHTICESGVEK